jgi:WD40 repeat protein
MQVCLQWARSPGMLIAIALLTCGEFVRGQEVAKAAPLLSAAGSSVEPPLPEGAITRLGTSLFRAKSEGGVLILPDDETIVTESGFFELHSGRKLREFEHGDLVIRRMAVTPQNTSFATLGFWLNESARVMEQRLRLWDFEGRLLSSIVVVEPRGEPFCFAISPDQKWAATAGMDCPIRVFDLMSSREVKNSSTPGGRTEAMAFTLNGESLVYATSRGVYQWKWRHDAEPVQVPVAKSSAQFVTFTPDGRTLVVVQMTEDGRVSLIDFETQTLKAKIQGKSGACFARAAPISSDGRLFLPFDSGAVEIWNLATATLERTLTGSPVKFMNVAITSDGSYAIAGGGWDTVLKAWNTRTGELIQTPAGHDNPIIAIEFSPDGKRVLTGGFDGTARLWSAAHGRQLQVLPHNKGQVRGITFSPDGRFAASSSGDNFVRVWDCDTGEQVHTFEGSEGSKRSLRFTPSNDRLLAWGDDRTLRKWDLATGELISNELLEAQSSPEDAVLGPGVAMSVVGGWFSWDASSLTVGEHARFSVFDTLKGGGRQGASWRGTVRAMCPSPDGSLLAVNRDGAPYHFLLADGRERGGPSREHTLQLVDWKQEKTLWEQKLPDGYYHNPAFSADGRFLAVVHRETTGSLFVFETSTGRQTARIDGPGMDGWAVALSPKGDRAATAAYAGPVTIWDLSKFAAR